MRAAQQSVLRPLSFASSDERESKPHGKNTKFLEEPIRLGVLDSTRRVLGLRLKRCRFDARARRLSLVDY